jgi:hypothetical protein
LPPYFNILDVVGFTEGLLKYNLSLLPCCTVSNPDMPRGIIRVNRHAA